MNKEWFSNEENKILIPKLVGRKVVRVKHFDNGSFDEGWYIYFDDGQILNARDGEYGDDAFRFVEEEENIH